MELRNLVALYIFFFQYLNKSILDKNFNYILASTQAINNNQYVDTYVKYFYDIGLDKPNSDTDVLVNQVNFMTSTNFNNVYLFMVPKFGTIRNEKGGNQNNL